MNRNILLLKKQKIFGIRNISRKYNIPKSTLSDWCRSNMLPSEQIKRLKQRGRKSNLTESELQDFKNWVLNQNRKGIICGGNVCIDYLYQKYAWKPSKSSISRIFKKIRISSHKTISKKPTQLQPNFHKKLENFKLELNKLVIDKTKKYPNFNIWVMDEKGIWNHHPSRRTYTSIDNPMPYVKELSNNQKRYNSSNSFF
ncbi:hypothetical protein M0812_28896 [Anaeramoeba flamelloides]|uniref:Transposase n=1 Tax=Anaeramoeba flamelloides TaxID=1746091 RepID=A0AAV7YC17_9EUKA|nr:hypothetical protein M0812_28896 [Anaeramoeba flamelloides]